VLIVVSFRACRDIVRLPGLDGAAAAGSAPSARASGGRPSPPRVGVRVGSIGWPLNPL